MKYPHVTPANQHLIDGVNPIEVWCPKHDAPSGEPCFFLQIGRPICEIRILKIVAGCQTIEWDTSYGLWIQQYCADDMPVKSFNVSDMDEARNLYPHAEPGNSLKELWS